MKIYITTLFALLTVVSFGQIPASTANSPYLHQKKSIVTTGNSYMITIAGERIACPGSIELSAAHVSYQGKYGKMKKIKHSKLKSMFVAGRVFLNLPITDSKNRMQEVVAYNDKHILTTYFQNGNFLYIYDRNYKPLEWRIWVWAGEDRQNALVDKTIVKYFGDCTELIQLMKSNIAHKPSLISNVSLFKCGSSNLELT